MSSANLGWLFYKDYYSAIDDWTEPKKSKQAISKKVDNLIAISSTIKETTALGNTHFKATTTYPGLILGSGNAHELPSIEGQAILGFHFDYTTGLPTIQGSSIKGVLRSAFKHSEYIAELLEDKIIDIKAIESEIFVNNDIFFDAQIVDETNKPIQILGDDYLAPHKNTKKKKFEDGTLVPDLLCNPIPLRFIKVLPNISFRFDFELSDGLLTKEQKRKLFQNILEDLGLGAKTNVGYGKFCDFKAIAKTKDELEKEAAVEAEKEEERLNKLSPLERIFDEYENSIPNIINAMKAKEIEEEIFVELAKKIKIELEKNPKEWEKAKQKALKRKEYIESVLGE